MKADAFKINFTYNYTRVVADGRGFFCLSDGDSKRAGPFDRFDPFDKLRAGKLTAGRLRAGPFGRLRAGRSADSCQ